MQSLKLFFVYRRQQLLHSGFLDQGEPFLQKMSDLFCAVHSPVIKGLDDLKEIDADASLARISTSKEPSQYLDHILSELIKTMPSEPAVEFDPE